MATYVIANLITRWFGLPSSSSHALIGGYAGAAVAKAGMGALILSGWIKTLIFIFLSPIIGMAAGFLLMTAIYWGFRNVSPKRVDTLFRRLQLFSAALFSISTAPTMRRRQWASSSARWWPRRRPLPAPPTGRSSSTCRMPT